MGKSIEGIRELQEYGFNMLTGEACGVSMRLLVDLTEQGCLLLGSMLGGAEFTSENWNSGAVKSTMLPRSIFADLAAWCLLQDPEVEVVTTSPKVQGDQYAYALAKSWTQEEWKKYRHVTEYTNSYYRSGTARGGLSNRHEFSGRVQ